MDNIDRAAPKSRELSSIVIVRSVAFRPILSRRTLRTVGRTKRRFVEGNLERALSEEPRPGAERKLTGKEEALLVATACAKPPAGCKRWTLLGRDRLAHLADQLDGSLVEADQRPGGILRLGVGGRARSPCGQHIRHTWGMHHMSLRHGLGSFAANRRRTVSPNRLL